SGEMRSFAPTSHRHSAEIIQELGLASANGQGTSVAFSATAVEAVRGILVTAHVFLNEDLDEKALWKIYRSAFNEEPFMRIVKESQGIHRYPNPKILSGTNYCDVGFERDPLLADVAACREPLVIVHGTTKELNALSTRLGHPPRMDTSERGEVSRFTDETTMDHFLMAYAGKQNKRIVERLRALDANAVG